MRVKPHANLTSHRVILFVLPGVFLQKTSNMQQDERGCGASRHGIEESYARSLLLIELFSLVCLERQTGGVGVRRHGNDRRNRTVDATLYGVVDRDDSIAISICLPRLAAAVEIPGADSAVDNDENRAAHVLATRRSTASPWWRRR